MLKWLVDNIHFLLILLLISFGLATMAATYPSPSQDYVKGFDNGVKSTVEVLLKKMPDRWHYYAGDNETKVMKSIYFHGWVNFINESRGK